MFLNNSDFEEVIRKTPIVAIDLCITNNEKILLGKRNNPPARDFYFVPGGRIRKSESINQALTRLIYDETGRKLKIESQIKLIGIFEHFYDDNFLGNYDFNSHYVVIAYSLPLNLLTDRDPDFSDKQHSKLIWVDFKKDAKLDIHKYTKTYFKYL